MKTLYITLTAGLLLQPFALADLTYQETTRITGGSMQGMLKMAGAFSSQAKQANVPTTTTVELHGNRMVRSNPHTTEIIDLDQQAITSIDHDKHTYSVMTFEQMRQAFAKAAAKGKQPAATTSNGSGPQMNFSAHVSSNSTTRQIDGRDAKEALVTLTMLSNANDGSNTKAGMAATSEMWLVSEVPGMAELRSFNKKMMQEMALDLSGGPMSGLLAAQPGGAEALADLKKESAKMSGFPVLQVTRVGMSADGQPLPAPSVAPLADHKTNSGGEMTRDVTTDAANQTANQETSKLGGIGRMIGGSGLGGLMHRKQANDSKTDGSQSQSDNPATAGVLLESQTETYNFSNNPVDVSAFQIPAGYKQITSPMARQ